MPRVSACVSCLNQPELLKQTLESIKAQTFTDWECLVVDDGSSPSVYPAFQEVAGDDPRFIFHRFEQNRGIPHGANWCYRNAKGDFIQTLGCDEFIGPTKFADQVEYLDAHPEIDLIWGVPGNGPMGPVPSWEQYGRGAHNRSKEHWLKTFLLLENVPVGGASALWRKSLFDSIGYFDSKLTAFSDHEWFCRVIEKHQVRILPYRWMNEVPGHKSICTRTPQNAAKLDAEYDLVRRRHPLQLPGHDGLITLAMPVYNHAKYIGDALRAVLAQTDQNFELLIVDDGSTDDLQAALKEFSDPRITFFRKEKNEGMMTAANEMLKIAKGEFFAIVSSDDTMAPDFLEKCRAAFASDPFLEYVASQNDFMNEDGTPYTGQHPFQTIQKASNRSVAEWQDTFYRGNVYFGIGVYRTSALREVGGWEPEHGVISDYQMYLKLIPRYNFRVIEEPLTHTRIHGGNQSLLKPQEAKTLKHTYFKAQRPFYQPRPRIVIATPFYELKGFSPYITSLTETTRTLTNMGIDWVFMDLSGDSYVHRARNSMCMNFLADPYNTDLFFIDSDMAWDVNAFVNMIYRPEPIIGGTYPVKNKWEMWTSKAEIVDPETDPHMVGHPLPDGSNLIKALQLAGGFLRIKRSVLERFIEFYPTHRYADTHPVPEMRMEQVEFFTAGLNREPEINLLRDIETLLDANGGVVDLNHLRDRFADLKKPREFIGEDYSFSNRLRNMGVPLFIFPNATITHFGVHGWGGNFNTTLREQQKQMLAESAKAA